MQFVNISDDDLALFESLNCDPVMMAELGGPTPKARVPQILQNSVESVENGTCWYYKIIPDDSEEVAGTVCIWENTHHGESINEMGWTILPPFQGKGLGSKAVRAVLDKARAENRSGGRLLRGTRWRTQPRSGRTPSGMLRDVYPTRGQAPVS